MKKTLLLTLLLALFISSASSMLMAQVPGSVDLSFNPNDEGYNNEINGIVYGTAVQPDGKIIMVGTFTLVKGVAKNRIARLLDNGLLDPSFNQNAGVNGDVLAVVIDASGRIIIGGSFSQVNGVPRSGIARLTVDGDLDTSFDPGSGASSAVRALAIDDTGRILIAGSFTTYNGTNRNRVSRLNADGTLDTNFDPGTGANGNVYGIQIDQSGNILLVGEFNEYNGTTRNRVVRVSNGGTIDNTFNPGAGPDGIVRTVKVDAQNRIFIAGTFDQYDGNNRRNVVRLQADGRLDTGFTNSACCGDVNTIQIVQSTKILIAGNNFSNNIRLLDANGAIEATFTTTITGPVFSLTLDSSNRIILGGSFTAVNSNTRNRIARINADGTLDPVLNKRTGIDGVVRTMKVDSQGRIYIGGDFLTVDGVTRNRIARLNPDGTLDETFNPGTGANQNVNKLEIDSNGKVVIVGNFTTVNGTNRSRVARLNSDGSHDLTFNPGLGANCEINALAFDSIDRVLIGGCFEVIDGISRIGIARLNNNGTLDISFNSEVKYSRLYYWANFNYIGYHDNFIYAGGNFIGSNLNIFTPSLFSLDDNGNINNNFALSNYKTTTNCCDNYSVYNTYELNFHNDDLYLSGDPYFATFPSQRPSNGFVKLNSNGSFEKDFVSEFSSVTFQSLVDENNRIVTIGRFDVSYQINPFTPYPRKYITRLLPNGSIDLSFQVGTGPNGPNNEGHINAVAFDPDGNILIAGDFTSFNGIGRNRIARLYGGGPTEANALQVQTQPVGGTLGQQLATQPAVRIVDASSNLVGYDSFTQVTAQIHSGAGGTLTGTTTVTAANGVASFTDLVMNGVAGTEYVLQFTAPGLTPVLSAPFTMTAPETIPTFYVSNPSALSGETGDPVYFDVNLDGASGLGVTSVNFKVTYNPSVMFLSRNMASTDGTIMPEATVTVNDRNLGEFIVTLANPSGLAVNSSGLLIRLGGYFLDAGDPAVAVVAREHPHLPLLPVPNKEAVFPATSYAGTVTGPASIALSPGPARATVSGTVDIPITVGDLSDRGVLGFVLELQYDPSFVTFVSGESAVVRTGTLVGTSTRTQLEVTANNVTGRIRVAGTMTGNDGYFYSGTGTLLTLRGTAGALAGQSALLMPYVSGEGGSYLNSGLRYSSPAGTLTVNPPLVAAQAQAFTVHPSVVNTSQSAVLTLDLTGGMGSWASFGRAPGGPLVFLATAQDGSDADLNAQTGRVGASVPASLFPGTGTFELRGVQSNVDIATSAELNGVSGSLLRSAQLTVVQPPAVWGNIDGDGMLSPVDVSYLLQYVVSLRELTPSQRNWVDVNLDGNVNSLDASLLLQKLLTPSYCLPAAGGCPSKESYFEGILAWHEVVLDGRRYYELRLERASGVTSAELSIDGLTGADRGWVTVPEGWMAASNATGSTLVVAMAGASPEAQATVLRVPAEMLGDFAALKYGRVELNGAAVADPLPPGVVTSLDEDATIPTQFALRGNYPNPFNPSTTIRFDLPEASSVAVTVYDLTGRVMMQVPPTAYKAGRHTMLLDASRLGSGVYLYRLRAGSFEGVGKMTLIK